MNRFQPVARIRQRAVHDCRECIGEITLLQRLAQIDALYRSWRWWFDSFTHDSLPPIRRVRIAKLPAICTLHMLDAVNDHVADRLLAPHILRGAPKRIAQRLAQCIVVSASRPGHRMEGRIERIGEESLERAALPVFPRAPVDDDCRLGADVALLVDDDTGEDNAD